MAEIKHTNAISCVHEMNSWMNFDKMDEIEFHKWNLWQKLYFHMMHLMIGMNYIPNGWIYVHESNHNIDEVDNMDDKKNYMDEIEQMLKFHYINETKFIDENDHHLYLFVCLSICVRLIWNMKLFAMKQLVWSMI
jgi:hypothetical protein